MFWNHLSLKNSQWLTIKLLDWMQTPHPDSQRQRLLVDCPVFFSRSPAYIGRFGSVHVGTWPIYITLNKNCNEFKILSQLQPSKVAYYGFMASRGSEGDFWRETKGSLMLCAQIAECQHVGANSSSPTSYSAENCGVSVFGGANSSSLTLYRSAQREWDSKDRLCYRRGTKLSLGSFL